MTADQVVLAAIAAVVVILVAVGVVRAVGRRRGANEDAFGAGGVPYVAPGTTRNGQDGPVAGRSRARGR